MKKKTSKLLDSLDKLLNVIIGTISLIVLFISAYSLLDNLWLYRNAFDDTLLTYKPELNRSSEPESSWISLEGQVAWLCIDNSYIDFPVMQGKSNYEYLSKDPYGEFKNSGSIFLDYRNAADMRDEYSMIYGHHMNHYAMFGSLDLFLDDYYFKKHTTGWIATKDGIYDLKVFAVSWADGADHRLFSPSGKSADDIIDYIETNAVINTGYEPGNKIIALSTCAGETFTSRLVVFCMMKMR